MLRARSNLTYGVAVLVLLAIATTALASDPPTIEVLSAFLGHQKTQSVEVTYALSRVSVDHATDVSDGTVTYYVRTPEAVYLREQYPLLPGARVTEYSWDRGTGEYRSLARAQDRTPNGLVTSGLPIGPLASQDLCDPIEVSLFPDQSLRTVRLDQWLGKGVVCPTQEEVDGYQCWRVDIANPRDSVQAYHIWLDPGVGFCPRRFSIVYAGLTLSTGFKDYSEVAGGIWYPMTRTFDDPKGQYQMITHVRSVAVGKAFPKDGLIVKFPSGTRVRDEALDIEYVVP